MRDMTKKLNIFTLQLRIYYILEQEISHWCKCQHCKNEAREVDCLCYREVDGMLIASAKIPEREGNLAIQLLWATTRLLVTRVSLIYLVDLFFFVFLLYLNKMKTHKILRSQLRTDEINYRQDGILTCFSILIL